MLKAQTKFSLKKRKLPSYLNENGFLIFLGGGGGGGGRAPSKKGVSVELGGF